MKFDYSSGLQIIFSSYNSIKNWNLGLILTKYSRKTKPQLLNKATGSFKWIWIFSMWTQSIFLHFSLLACRAVQRKRASSPPYLPDCHTDYFKYGRKSLWCNLQQSSALMYLRLHSSPYRHQTHQSWKFKAEVSWWQTTGMNHELEKKTWNEAKVGRGRLIFKVLQPWNRTFPSDFLIWPRNCRAVQSVPGPGTALVQPHLRCVRVSLHYWQMLPLTLRAPFSLCLHSPIPPSLPAAPQSAGIQGCPGSTIQRQLPACRPASHSLWEHSRKTPGNKENQELSVTIDIKVNKLGLF